MNLSIPSSSLRALAFLTLVGCGADITAPMVGTYTGAIVAGAVIDTHYTVSVAAVDGDTIAISGADFATFEVDVMDVGGSVTQVAGDDENTLSWTDGLLSFAHTAGAESVTFDGAQAEGSGDTGGNGGDTGGDNGGDNGGDTAGDSGGNGGDTGGDQGPSAIAEGDYVGAALGPVMDPTYTLTLTVVDADTVRVSGEGITSFEVPLSGSGTHVEASSVWHDGTCTLNGSDLALVYDPTGFSFSGTKQ